MNVTGTQVAEHAPPGRSQSFGHALSAWLVGKTTGLPRLIATHENGESTEQPGAPPVGLAAPR